jgi:hypothetical protein
MDIANAMIEMASLDAKGQKVGGVLCRPHEAASELRWFDEYPAIETHLRTEVQSGATFVGIVYYQKGSSKPTEVFVKKYGDFLPGSLEHRAIDYLASSIGPVRFISGV